MEFYNKLPRNKKELALFILIVSLISVNTIAPLVTFLEVGFSFDVYKDVLKVLPFIWLSVVAVVVLTYVPAEWLTNKLVKKEDSYSAHIIINILCSVFFISIFMTVIGTWIGSRHISMEPITHFIYKWPRNFGLAFFIELLVAQPIARFVITQMHKVMDKNKQKNP